MPEGQVALLAASRLVRLLTENDTGGRVLSSDTAVTGRRGGAGFLGLEDGAAGPRRIATGRGADYTHAAHAHPHPVSRRHRGPARPAGGSPETAGAREAAQG